jgi:hypothetical protein
MMSTEFCPSCKRPFTDVSAISFWDGRAYCPSCLKIAMSGLSQLAQDRPEFAEVSIVKSPRAGPALGMVAIAIGSIAVAVLLPAAGVKDTWSSILVVGLFLAWTITALNAMKAERHALISVRAGVVTVSTRFWRLRRPLSACRWRVVEATAGESWWPREVIEMQILRSTFGVETVVTSVFCGLSPLTVELWRMICTGGSAMPARSDGYRLFRWLVVRNFAVAIAILVTVGVASLGKAINHLGGEIVWHSIVPLNVLGVLMCIAYYGEMARLEGFRRWLILAHVSSGLGIVGTMNAYVFMVSLGSGGVACVVAYLLVAIIIGIDLGHRVGWKEQDHATEEEYSGPASPVGQASA